LVNEDYITLLKFWKDNRFPAPAFDDLPTVDRKLQGLMVYNEDIEICAGFIIDTTVKNGAMIEYIVSNFDVKDKSLRKESLNFLITKLKEVAKHLGKKYVFTSVKNPALIERFKECGIVVGSTNTTEMIGQI
jgi:hypothetical protein